MLTQKHIGKLLFFFDKFNIIFIFLFFLALFRFFGNNTYICVFSMACKISQMDLASKTINERYCFYQKTALRVFVSILSFALIFIVPVFSAESDYYQRFDRQHKTASKVLHIDQCYNGSIEEFTEDNQQYLAKCEQIRFNYFDKDGTLCVVYGNPNSLVKPFCMEFSYKANDSIPTISNKLRDSVITSANAYIISENSEIINRYRNLHIDLTPYFLNNQDTIELFLLPSWQLSGKILNSSEYHFKYFLDRKTSDITLLASDSTIVEARYFNSGSDEIALKYSDLETPPIGAFLFSFLYHDYFGRILLETKSKSAYLLNPAEGSYVHLDN